MFNSGEISVEDNKLTTHQRTLALKQALIGLNIPEKTANRVARWLQEYQVPETDVLYGGVLGEPFVDDHDEMVIVKDIDFIGLCEHHLLPFRGKAAIGYIPDGLLLGLSKTARIVEYFCRQPTLQEHITTNVCHAIEDVVNPKGTMVVLYNVEHVCMSMRGIKSAHARTTTSAITGVFRDNPPARQEFLALLNA